MFAKGLLTRLVFTSLLVVSILFSHLGSRSAHAASDDSPNAADGLPVKGFLNPDGTLNLASAPHGAFDLSGWKVALDVVRGPILSPAGGGANAPLSAIGDWSALGSNGAGNGSLNTQVNALAVIGTDLYVGGDFTNAGAPRSGSHRERRRGRARPIASAPSRPRREPCPEALRQPSGPDLPRRGVRIERNAVIFEEAAPPVVDGVAGGGEAVARGAGLEFGYPVDGEPCYYVKAGFTLPDIPAELEAAAWSVDRVAVDGVRVRDLVVTQKGREIDKNGIKASDGSIVFDVKTRTVWRPGAVSSLRVDIVEPKSGELKYVEASGTAPPGKGY